jgi:two-component system nitrogen regulation sensor histidine kinase NtrY
MLRPPKIARWVIVSVLLFGGVWILYVLVEKLADDESGSQAYRFILPLLSISLVVLFLALAGLLVRNLVRLVVDRKRGILGSRMRAKLVFFLLGFVLFPALIMVYGSAAVLKQTVEALGRTPVEEVSRYSKEIVDDWNDDLREGCARAAASLGETIASVDASRVGPVLQRWIDAEPFDYVFLTTGPGETTLRLRADPGLDAGETDSLAEHAGALAAEVVGTGAPTDRIDDTGTGLLVHAAAPVVGAEGASPGEPAVVAVGRMLPEEIADKMRLISRQAEAYRQFRLERRELVNLFLMVIGIIFLVTLFLATWIGFYLTRRITEPMREVAAAAGEISAGNLGVRVRSTSGDEVGVLVDSFNAMAAQLQESREVIGRSTADLRASNRALEERRRYIETLVANLSTAVISLDTEGRVTTANPAVQEILGVRVRPGDDLLRTLGGEDLAPLVDFLRNVQAEESAPVGRELVLPSKASPRSVAVQATALRGSRGERLGTLIMVEDLTDLIRAQRAAAWKEVARRIAHEIKNPLTPIQLAAQRMRKKFDAGSQDLDQVVREATGSIEREVSGLKQLVDEFSRFARMPEIAPSSVDLMTIIESVQGLYKGHPGVHWIVDADEDIGTVKVDADQLRRAIINLVENAIAAMPEGGTVTLAAHRAAGNGTLHIEVSDTGPGIPPEDRDKLFVPYFSTKRSGTGLGLAIVHRVVTEHRGTIRVEDNDPHGARFIMELPV